jgi:hypothetical protein
MKRKKKGIPPAFAILFFVVSAGVAGYAMLGQLNPRVGVTTSAGEVVGELPDPQAGSSGTMIGEPWPDLLAEYGSYDKATAVRAAFSSFAGAEFESAAPLVEGAASSTGWVGADPPELKLGVVMVSGDARRAVLGGQVVGIGEEVQGVRLRGIRRDHVVGIWGARRLTYDLVDGWPREFRPERARRAALALESETAGGEGAGETPIEELNQMLRAKKER